MKVTWSTSGRIHRTPDGLATVCGHVFRGPGKTIHGIVQIVKNRRHCKTCFQTKAEFAEPWYPAKTVIVSR